MSLKVARSPINHIYIYISSFHNYPLNPLVNFAMTTLSVLVFKFTSRLQVYTKFSHVCVTLF